MTQVFNESLNAKGVQFSAEDYVWEVDYILEIGKSRLMFRVTLNIRNLEYRSRLYMLKGSEVHLQKRCCNNNSGLDVDEPQIQTIDICNWLHSQPLFDYDLTMGIQSRRVALRCDLQKIYPLFSDLFIVFFNVFFCSLHEKHPPPFPLRKMTNS